MHPDPRERFTDRVEAYARHRPGYPRSVLDRIREATGLEPSWVVADAGSGTGLSSLPFLNQGTRVLAIEPNAAMRAAAEHFLGSRPNFRSVTGSAEATGLEPESVDLVVAGQAFHWFDPVAAKIEFRRILRAPGWVAIIWNRRRTSGDAFSERYEALLHRFGTDYAEVRHDALSDEDIRGFFEDRVRCFTVPNEQSLDLEGLRGRLLSSSYTPAADDPAREAMLHALDGVFSATHEDGYVRMLYDTEIWVGALHADG
jgi:SAM-dependent methyltransferase